MAGFLINSRGATLMIDPLLSGFDMPLLALQALEFGLQVAHDVNPAGRATEVDRMATASRLAQLATGKMRDGVYCVCFE